MWPVGKDGRRPHPRCLRLVEGQPVPREPGPERHPEARAEEKAAENEAADRRAGPRPRPPASRLDTDFRGHGISEAAARIACGGGHDRAAPRLAAPAPLSSP